MRTYMGLILTLGLTLGACDAQRSARKDLTPTDSEPTASAPAASATADVVGSWVLVSLGGRAALPGTTLELKGDALEGGSGCNGYNGPYTLIGSKIGVKEVMRTERACVDRAKMQQETDYFAMLAAVTTAARKGDVLTLGGARGLLVFKRAEDPSSSAMPPQPDLSAGSWRLDSIMEGEVASRPLAGRDVVLAFVGDRVTVRQACNNASGEYTSQGSALKVIGLRQTMAACGGDQGEALMRQDALVLKLLAGVTSHEIKGSTLTLMAGERPVLRCSRTPAP